MHHHVRVDVEEALLRSRPWWPSTRPPFPVEAHCRECAKGLLCWVWRFSRALHVLAIETPHTGPPPAAVPAGGQQQQQHGADCCPDGWVPRLPDILLDAQDYVVAAAACRAAGDWASEAAQWMRDHGDPSLVEYADLADCEFVEMSQDFMRVVLHGDWNRVDTVRCAENLVHHMTELFIAPWDE